MPLDAILRRTEARTAAGVDQTYDGHRNRPPQSKAPVPQRVALPCVNEGEVAEGATCGCASKHVYWCLHPDVEWDRCVRTGSAVPDVMSCDRCPKYRSELPVLTVPQYDPNPVLRWVSTKRLVADAIRLAGMLPLNTRAVAGVPRSGMIPASVVATVLQLPLYQLTEEGTLSQVGHGSRGRLLGFRDANGPVAVIDDTVYSGTAMTKARNGLRQLQVDAIFAAVYARAESGTAVDFYAESLPSPHLLEWNVANSGAIGGHAANPIYGAGIACDLDGIILHDDQSGGPVGTPYLTPRTVPTPAIVTGRHERSRPHTVAELAAAGAKYDRLVMLPDEVPFSPEAAAEHKAKWYGDSDCGLYMESDPHQAELIHRLTGKPVVCPVIETVFQSKAVPSGGE